MRIIACAEFSHEDHEFLICLKMKLNGNNCTCCFDRCTVSFCVGPCVCVFVRVCILDRLHVFKKNGGSLFCFPFVCFFLGCYR